MKPTRSQVHDSPAPSPLKHFIFASGLSATAEAFLNDVGFGDLFLFVPSF